MYGQKSNVLKLNVDDNRVGEILNTINILRELEKEYWESVDFEYNDNTSASRPTTLYRKTLFLADEEILWCVKNFEASCQNT